MHRTDQDKNLKKRWEKPRVFNLSVEADTKTGFLGASADFTNTTSANNTLTS
jgi:hypothetical protein